jgi:hypothetical protein
MGAANLEESRRRLAVVSLFVLGALGFAALVVFSVLGAVLGLVGFAISLPFRLIGWTLKLGLFLLALPFLLVFGLIAAIFGLLPFAPFALLAWFVWWLFGHRGKAQRSHATVAS